MEGIFEQCLLRCPHVELWRLYLQYLRQEKRCQSKEVQQAFELLLEAVGPDVGSGPLWIEYVTMLRDQVEPGMMAMSNPVTAARDAFQRALVQHRVEAPGDAGIEPGRIGAQHDGLGVGQRQ